MSRSRWNVQYMQRVLATDPIAHWMQDEKQGTVAYDMVTARSNGARNGAYTGVTLGAAGIGDGRTSPFYDGALDYTDIWTPSFRDAFNGTEGSFALWCRVNSAADWADGVGRFAFLIRADGNNQVRMQKTVAANQFNWTLVSGGVAIGANALGIITTTEFFHVMVTWSEANDEFIGYLNGVRQFLLNGLGVWVGLPAVTLTLVGASSQAPATPWHGNLAHPAAWDRPLPQVEALYLAGVP